MGDCDTRMQRQTIIMRSCKPHGGKVTNRAGNGQNQGEKSGRCAALNRWMAGKRALKGHKERRMRQRGMRCVYCRCVWG